MLDRLKAAKPEPINLGYEPRKQFMPFHRRKQRWAVLVCHRRAGKTVACVMDLLDRAVRDTRDMARYGYIAPYLKQAKSVAWDYLKFYALKVPGATVNETELRVDFQHNGARVRLFGADNMETIRGNKFDGVVLDEAADVSPRLFQEIVRPALSDRKGWAVWIGTPKGQNDFYDLIFGKEDIKGAKDNSEYFFQIMKASETGIIEADELASAKNNMMPEQYEQEYECSFNGVMLGAYYGREMAAVEDEGRVVSDLYDPRLQVHTCWDLGASDDTVIWFFQMDKFRVHWIDYYAANGYGLEHYAGVLDEKRRQRKYLYGKHHFPHDVNQKFMGGGYIATTRKKTLEGLGIPVTTGARVKDVSERINAVRRVLPRSYFERDRTAEGRKALVNYHREYDDVRKVFMEKPEHNWASHPADAFGEGCTQMNNPQVAVGKSAVKPRSMAWVV